jgi:Protein of unknown function (DUF3592)
MNGRMISYVFRFLIIMLFFGMFLNKFISACKNLIVGFQSKKWSAVQGKLTQYRILENRGGPQTGTTYTCISTYKYMINNTNYFSEFEQRGFHSYKAAECEVKTGKEYKFFYDPKNPQEVVFNPGLRLSLFWDLFSTFILLSLTTCLLVISVVAV